MVTSLIPQDDGGDFVTCFTESWLLDLRRSIVPRVFLVQRDDELSRTAISANSLYAFVIRARGREYKVVLASSYIISMHTVLFNSPRHMFEYGQSHPLPANDRDCYLMNANTYSVQKSYSRSRVKPPRGQAESESTP